MALQGGAVTLQSPGLISLQGGSPNLNGSGGTASKGAFWTGADGNVWVAGAAGTHSAGKADANTNAYWSSRGYTAQGDPNAPQTDGYGGANTGGYATGGGGSAAAAPKFDDKSADITFNNGQLGAVEGQRTAGIALADKTRADIETGYNTEAANNTTDYNTNSDQNQNNYQKNKASALVNAANGRKGLFGTLASLGALNGDGINLANDAVKTGADEDLSGANDTYANNQHGLDTVLKKFKDEDTIRRQNADTEVANQKQGINSSAAKDRQTYLAKLADDYTLEGKTDQAKTFADQAAALAPTIGAYSVPSATLKPQALSFTLPSLANYLNGTNATSVATTPNATNGSGVSGLPGLVASTKRKG